MPRRPNFCLPSAAAALPSTIQLRNTYPNLTFLWEGATITEPLRKLYNVQFSSKASPLP